MGILDGFKSKNQIGNKSNTTRGFYLGSAEAEAENIAGKQNLENFFDDYLDVLQQLKFGKFIFIGRKGAGKSAIAKYISDKSQEAEDSFSKIVRYPEVATELISNHENNLNVENKELLLFEWLILVQLIKLILLNKSGANSEGYSKLEKFLERNSGLVEIDKYQTNEVVVKKNWQVSFGVLKHSFGGLFKKYFDAKTNRAPFYALIPALKEVVKTVLNYEVNQNVEYLLLFDDLDIGFKASDESRSLKIGALLRASKNFNNELFKGTSAKVLVFLRDDIQWIIESYHADTAKIFSSYGIALKWYDHWQFKNDENSIPLKKFINRRIAINFDEHKVFYDEFDPWKTLISETDIGTSDKSSFKFILDHTFYRPRDLILFFKSIGSSDYFYPLSNDVVIELIKEYCKENVNELKNELSLFFTAEEIRYLFSDFLRKLSSNYNNPYRYTLNLLDKNVFSFSCERVIEILYSYTIIGYIDNVGRINFYSRGGLNTEHIDKEKMSITLAKPIYRYYNRDFG